MINTKPKVSISLMTLKPGAFKPSFACPKGTKRRGEKLKLGTSRWKHQPSYVKHVAAKA